MGKQESILVKTLGSSPVIKVIDFLLENYLFDYSKAEVARGADISRITLDKFWDEFNRRGIVVRTRRIGNGIMYKLNLKSPIVKQLKRLDFVLSSKHAPKLRVRKTV